MNGYVTVRLHKGDYNSYLPRSMRPMTIEELNRAVANLGRKHRPHIAAIHPTYDPLADAQHQRVYAGHHTVLANWGK
jgi:hypothetical protein